MEYGVLKAADFFGGEEIHVALDENSGHYGMHAHDFIEIFYVASGKGFHVIGGERVNIEKSDLFIMNTYVPHEYGAKKGTPLTAYNCLFKQGCIDSSFENTSGFVDVAYHYLFHSFFTDSDPKEYIKLKGVNSKRIGRILSDMYYECKEKQDGYRQVLKSDLIKLLIFIFRLYRQDTTQKQNAPVYKKLVVDNALSYFNENFGTAISLSAIAQRSYLSVSYFNKIFKDSVGQSPLQKLQEIRMENACRMLRDTKLPITEVGAAVGCADSKHFYRLFRKYMSMTPNEYRNEQNDHSG